MTVDAQLTYTPGTLAFTVREAMIARGHATSVSDALDVIQDLLDDGTLYSEDSYDAGYGDGYAEGHLDGSRDVETTNTDNEG